MIFSWSKLAAFFAALIVIAWLIYPNQYFRGLMHRRDSDRSLSVKLYRDYLSRHPHDKSAMLALSAAYEAQADPEAGIPVMEGLYSHRKGDLAVGREYLKLLERSGREAQAQDLRWRLFEDARKGSGTDRRELEELLYGYYQRAVVAQDGVATVRALTALSQIAKNRQSYLSALVRLNMARRDFPELIRLLQELKKDDPSDLYTRLSLIYVFQIRREFAAALREVNEALIVHPDHDALLGARAAIYEAQGRLDLALPDLERLAARQPKVALWRRDLAAAWLKTRAFGEAAPACRALLERFPKDDALWRLLIYAYSDRGRSAEAAALLEAYLARFPEDADAVDLLAFQYEMLGLKDKELAALGRYASAHPEDSERRRRWALLLLSVGRLSETAEMVRELLKSRPQDKELWWGLIYGLADAKRYREAAALLEEYLRVFPGDPDAADELIQSYLKVGQKAKAIALLKKHFARPGAKRPRRTHAAR